MRMLDGRADLDEQIEPVLGGQVVLVAVIGDDADAADQFHDEEGASSNAGFPQTRPLRELGSQRLLRSSFRFCRIDFLPRRRVPKLHGALAGAEHRSACRQSGSVGREQERSKVRFEFPQGHEFLASRGIPEFDCLVGAARGDCPAIRRKGHGVDARFVAL